MLQTFPVVYLDASAREPFDMSMSMSAQQWLTQEAPLHNMIMLRDNVVQQPIQINMLGRVADST